MAPEGPLLVPSVGLLYRFICANLVIVVVDCARVPVDHGGDRPAPADPPSARTGSCSGRGGGASRMKRRARGGGREVFFSLGSGNFLGLGGASYAVIAWKPIVSSLI